MKKVFPFPFQFPSSIKLVNMKGIQEGYQIEAADSHEKITALISGPRLESALESLFGLIQCPAYFVIEVPANKAEEDKLRKSNYDPMHININYRDNLSKDGMKKIFEKYGALFTGDGMARFGFGSHHQREEVFVYLYKIIYIYSADIAKYRDVLEAMGIGRVEKLHLPFDNLSAKTPGDRTTITVDGKTIYDAIEEMKAIGLYLAKTVPDR